MMRLVNLLFAPPPMPPISIPLAAKLIPNIKLTIQQACETFYFRGVLDGLIVGVLLVLLLFALFRRQPRRV